VARPVIPPRLALALVAFLITLRLFMAASLPLSADEAYYWLWSKHLAAGYFDHPPAIAWAIRAGTALFGDTPLGVRLAGIVLSLPASWCVWRSAALILKDEDRAALAMLFFNLTLMASVELLAATPDMPSVVTSAAFLYGLARLQAGGHGRWWLAVGVAAGLGLLSKYSALFLGLGSLVWLAADARQRHWLRSPWPYLGALLALLLFLPNLLWQAGHHWETFAFQFARVAGGHLTGRFLLEFLGAQLGLASPILFVLMLCGLWRGTRRGDAQENPRLLPAVLVWTGAAYFLMHALHDRVQGNWPCFLYPALAILAADAFAATGRWRWLSYAAAPLAAVMLLLTYAQAGWGVIALKKDPLARILGRDFAPIGAVAGVLVKAHMFDAILTTDYETTAWLRFTQPGLPVVQVNEPWRYPDAPAASGLRRAAYLTELRRDQHPLVQQQFGYLGYPTQLQAPSGLLYMLYPAAQPRQPRIGRMP
jgi:4-amino-4-deoxy-L-arabinose transferase-like glycosyltransferase